MEFNGNLTNQEKTTLKEHHISEIQIKIIQYHLKKYQHEITGLTDFVGDFKVPSNFFYLNMVLFGHLLKETP